MYRQMNNLMSAVEIVSSMYDGQIPADVMEAARAEDARYAQDPAAFEAMLAASAVTISNAQIAHCRSMVLAKIADVRRAVSQKDRDLFCGGVRHWIKKYRAEQAQARAMQEAA